MLPSAPTERQAWHTGAARGYDGKPSLNINESLTLYPTHLTDLLEPSKLCSHNNRIDNDDDKTIVTSNNTTNPQGWEKVREANSTQDTAHNIDGDITVYDDLGATDKELANGELEAGAYIATTTYPDLMLTYVKGRMNKWVKLSRDRVHPPKLSAIRGGGARGKYE